jgi:hypothetical protein
MGCLNTQITNWNVTFPQMWIQKIAPVRVSSQPFFRPEFWNRQGTSENQLAIFLWACAYLLSCISARKACNPLRFSFSSLNVARLSDWNVIGMEFPSQTLKTSKIKHRSVSSFVINPTDISKYSILFNGHNEFSNSSGSYPFAGSRRTIYPRFQVHSILSTSILSISDVFLLIFFSFPFLIWLIDPNSPTAILSLYWPDRLLEKYGDSQWHCDFMQTAIYILFQVFCDNHLY